MPTNIAAVLILVLALLPGAVGDWAYRLLLGIDWREREWRTVLRVLGYSVVGLALYVLLAPNLGLPPARHVFPNTYTSPDLRPETLRLIFAPYLGHVAGAGIAGVLGALAMAMFARISGVSAHPAAWDEFIRRLVPKHWVVVSLNSGDIYAGQLQHADTSVRQEERDIVLREPASYSRESGNYIATSYQFLFVPGHAIFSIAIVHDPAADKRLTAVNSPLFPPERPAETQSRATQASEPPDAE